MGGWDTLIEVNLVDGCVSLPLSTYERHHTRICGPAGIAEAFARVQYPVLPRVESIAQPRRGLSRFRRREILHIRHHSLYVPAD
jgi:hypothetical protein